MKRKLFSLILMLSVFLASGQINNSLHFDGYDDYITTGVASISGNNARTVEAWVRTAANCVPNAGGVQQVILEMGSFTPGQRFTVCLLWSNSIRVEIGGSGVSGTVAVNDSNWHHVAVVYNPSNLTKVQLYVDGVGAGSGNFSSTPNTSNANMIVGRRSDNINPFTGNIDELRVWNVARTGSQIQASMNGELCGNPSNLVLYYKMNEGVAGANNFAATSVPNMAGTNSGTLNNFDLNYSASNWVNGQNLNTTKYDTVVSQECNYFIAPDGSIWDSTAVYEYVFTAADGCDSIVTFDLTVDTVDNRATQNGIVLSALAANATFQWVDCSDSTEISGATNSTYVVSANGSYAVKVTQDSCEQWSECFTVDNIGLDEYSTNAYNLYPNPSNGHLFISPAPENGTEVILYSVTGTKVGTYDVQGGQVMLAPEVPSGSYLVVNKAINLRQPMIMVR